MPGFHMRRRYTWYLFPSVGNWCIIQLLSSDQLTPNLVPANFSVSTKDVVVNSHYCDRCFFLAALRVKVFDVSSVDKSSVARHPGVILPTSRMKCSQQRRFQCGKVTNDRGLF